MVAKPTPAIEIFFSYAHEDELLRSALEKHLSNLKSQGLITGWHDRNISAGQEWAHEIDRHLNSAQIILLLISADFTASTYCQSVEMKRALERHHQEEARVIPIILRACDWKGTPFEKLQALPTDGKPITSWTNPDEAFLNVVEGIRQAVEQLNMHPTMSRSSSFLLKTIPYDRNPLFTGREDILKHLSTVLRAGKTTALTQAISGLGGIGKTQTAIEYAHRYQDDYDTIVWIKADTRETTTADFVTMAHRLNLPERNEQDQHVIVEAVKCWFQTHTRWLLIFDNADDLTMTKDFLPSRGTGHILLTTRAHATGNIAQRIDVERMEPEEGALFLLHRATILDRDKPLAAASTDDRTKAMAISRMMDGLPLALDQAGAFIEETGCSLSDYLRIYHQRQVALLKRRGRLTIDHAEPVATTWSLCFQKVEQTNPAAADLLRLCAFLDPDAIPEEIMTKGASALGSNLQAVVTDPITFQEAIGELLTFSLIRRNPDHTLTIHRLVQAVLKHAMNKSTQRRWAERMVRAINLAFPEVEYETWLLCQQYLPHAQVCANLIEQWDLTFPEAAHVLMQAAKYLSDRAQYTQAEPLYQRALAIRERMQGEHPDTATTLNNLALLYRAQGLYEKAEPLYQRALTIRERILGEHPDTATTLDNLAGLYRAQGLYEKAEPLYQRALAIRERMLGEHPDTAASLNNLAGLYEAQGLYEKAEPLYQRALAIRERMQGEHPDTATTLNNLAGLYEAQGLYEKAESLYQRALAIHERMQGEHPDTATSLDNLAGLYEAQGLYEKAEPLYQRALAISERMQGEHPDTATTLNNLALLYRAQGLYEKAEPLYQRALAIREQNQKV